MKTTQILSKGRVTLPKETLKARDWKSGTVLSIVETAGGVLLSPLKPFPPTRIEDVFGSAKYRGKPKTLAEMAAAIRADVRRTGR